MDYKGFEQFRNMVERGEISLGDTITIIGSHDTDYRFSAVDLRHGQKVYKLSDSKSNRNARNLLINQTWFVKSKPR
ncbi:MAG: hypothetical protein ABIG30_00580 [Candidatus Aenigmatarchaeota archaeon]